MSNGDGRVSEPELVMQQGPLVSAKATSVRYGHTEKAEAAGAALRKIRAQRLRIQADRALVAVGIDPDTFKSKL